MSGLAEKWNAAAGGTVEALEQLVERQGTQEQRTQQLEDRTRGLSDGVRLELFTLSTEIRTERQITRDLVDAVHRRIDGFEAAMMESLRRIERVLTTNGSGGSHV